MIYVEIIDNKVTRSTEFEIIGSKYENMITTEYADYTPSNNKYVYDVDSNSIILNPNYEDEEAEKARQARIAELKEQLKVLDEKAGRSVRAILAGTGTDEDRAYLQNIEEQAQEIRKELHELDA